MQSWQVRATSKSTKRYDREIACMAVRAGDLTAWTRMAYLFVHETESV